MVKILVLLVVLVMILHLIKPIGLPGLKRRGDVWKIALLVIAGMMLAVIFRPG